LEIQRFIALGQAKELSIALSIKTKQANDVAKEVSALQSKLKTETSAAKGWEREIQILERRLREIDEELRTTRNRIKFINLKREIKVEKLSNSVFIFN